MQPSTYQESTLYTASYHFSLHCCYHHVITAFITSILCFHDSVFESRILQNEIYSQTPLKCVVSEWGWFGTRFSTILFIIEKNITIALSYNFIFSRTNQQMKSSATPISKRSSSSTALSSVSSPTAAAKNDEPIVIVLPAPTNSKRKWMEVPKPEGTIALLTTQMVVFKVDTVTIYIFIVYECMGQPDEVVEELNAALNSHNVDQRTMAINIVMMHYVPIAVISQGNFI